MIDPQDKQILRFLVFRNRLGSPVSAQFIEKWWGDGSFSNLQRSVENCNNLKLKLLIDSTIREDENIYVREKINRLSTRIDFFILKYWVLFIGVSGSVAAGNPTREDDIDLFVIVRNNRMWLYRGFMLLKSMFSGRRTTKKKSAYQDEICVNFICEERGMKMDENMFVLHELVRLIPVYNEMFFPTLLSENQWLSNFGVVSAKQPSFKQQDRDNKIASVILDVLNYLACLSQVFYMTLLFHSPDFKRLTVDNARGSIRFYPKSFADEKMSEFFGLIKKDYPEII